ncbi:MAG: flavoprotein [Nitrospinae bacterium]|nr:flavoprotein [Nitrospinota bacterium]
MGGKTLAKIAWGITGAGHFLRESLEAAAGLGDVDFFASEAGAEVLKLYGAAPPSPPRIDKSASTLACRAFAAGTYDLLVIAPATSNSVAKFVHGISDTMITTLFAQAGKCRVPIVVLPTDVEEVIDTMGATKPIRLYARPVDLENVEKLKTFPGVKVAATPEELSAAIAEVISLKR